MAEENSGVIWQKWWGDAGAVVAILGAIWALGKKIGRQEHAMKQIKVKVECHDITLTAHTAELADGKGNFKVIDNKLDNIKEGQKELREILIEHVSREKQ
jgi:hypothetical protein